MNATYTSSDAQAAVHYFFPSELPVFKNLIASLPPDPVVVNIGAGAGVSGLAILETREDVYLHTVDIQDESSPFGCLAGERQVMEQAGLDHLFEKRWFQYHMDSKKLARQWNLPCDLVYVDGDHSYEGAAGDIRLWMPHIKPGGYIAVHDYGKDDLLPDQEGPHPKSWPGVDKAVNELLWTKWIFMWRIASLIVFRNYLSILGEKRKDRGQAYHCHQ